MNFILNNLDWLAGGSELVGLWLVGHKRRTGFILNACCCLTWTFIAIHRGIPGLLLVAVPAFFINIRNYWRWRKEERKSKRALEFVTRVIPAFANEAKHKDITDIFSPGVSG